MVLKDLLMFSQLTHVIKALYQRSLEVQHMVVVPVETVVETLGIHYIEQHLNFIADLQVVLHFVDKMMENPGEYTHYDYLEFRGEHLMRFRTAFIDKIRKSKRPQGSNRTQRLSPNG